jgi:hypothetical protein
MDSVQGYLLDNMLDKWRVGEIEDYAMADFLLECGMDEFAGHVRKGAPILEEIKDYDWRQAFGYAGEIDTHAEDRSYDKLNLDVAKPDDQVSTRLFCRKDVKNIVAMEEGEHDGANWRIVGELWDGRYFWLSAGCDYTGWD